MTERNSRQVTDMQQAAPSGDVVPVQEKAPLIAIDSAIASDLSAQIYNRNKPVTPLTIDGAREIEAEYQNYLRELQALEDAEAAATGQTPRSTDVQIPNVQDELRRAREAREARHQIFQQQQAIKREFREKAKNIVARESPTEIVAREPPTEEEEIRRIVRPLKRQATQALTSRGITQVQAQQEVAGSPATSLVEPEALAQQTQPEPQAGPEVKPFIVRTAEPKTVSPEPAPQDTGPVPEVSVEQSQPEPQPEPVVTKMEQPNSPETPVLEVLPEQVVRSNREMVQQQPVAPEPQPGPSVEQEAQQIPAPKAAPVIEPVLPPEPEPTPEATQKPEARQPEYGTIALVRSEKAPKSETNAAVTFSLDAGSLERAFQPQDCLIQAGILAEDIAVMEKNLQQLKEQGRLQDINIIANGDQGTKNSKIVATLIAYRFVSQLAAQMLSTGRPAIVEIEFALQSAGKLLEVLNKNLNTNDKVSFSFLVGTPQGRFVGAEGDARVYILNPSKGVIMPPTGNPLPDTSATLSSSVKNALSLQPLEPGQKVILATKAVGESYDKVAGSAVDVEYYSAHDDFKDSPQKYEEERRAARFRAERILKEVILADLPQNATDQEVLNALFARPNTAEQGRTAIVFGKSPTIPDSSSVEGEPPAQEATITTEATLTPETEAEHPTTVSSLIRSEKDAVTGKSKTTVFSLDNPEGFQYPDFPELPDVMSPAEFMGSTLEPSFLMSLTANKDKNVHAQEITSEIERLRDRLLELKERGLIEGIDVIAEPGESAKGNEMVGAFASLLFVTSLADILEKDNNVFTTEAVTRALITTERRLGSLPAYKQNTDLSFAFEVRSKNGACVGAIGDAIVFRRLEDGNTRPWVNGKGLLSREMLLSKAEVLPLEPFDVTKEQLILGTSAIQDAIPDTGIPVGTPKQEVMDILYEKPADIGRTAIVVGADTVAQAENPEVVSTEAVLTPEDTATPETVAAPETGTHTVLFSERGKNEVVNSTTAFTLDSGFNFSELRNGHLLPKEESARLFANIMTGITPMDGSDQEIIANKRRLNDLVLKNINSAKERLNALKQSGKIVGLEVIADGRSENLGSEVASALATCVFVSELTSYLEKNDVISQAQIQKAFTLANGIVGDYNAANKLETKISLSFVLRTPNNIFIAGSGENKIYVQSQSSNERLQIELNPNYLDGREMNATIFVSRNKPVESEKLIMLNKGAYTDRDPVTIDQNLPAAEVLQAIQSAENTSGLNRTAIVVG